MEQEKKRIEGSRRDQFFGQDQRNAVEVRSPGSPGRATLEEGDDVAARRFQFRRRSLHARAVEFERGPQRQPGVVVLDHRRSLRRRAAPRASFIARPFPLIAPRRATGVVRGGGHQVQASTARASTATAPSVKTSAG
ncbi:MAG: hypothetical protein U0232_19900 [Thermomicrobiales bacterium]